MVTFFLSYPLPLPLPPRYGLAPPSAAALLLVQARQKKGAPSLAYQTFIRINMLNACSAALEKSLFSAIHGAARIQESNVKKTLNLTAVFLSPVIFISSTFILKLYKIASLTLNEHKEKRN